MDIIGIVKEWIDKILFCIKLSDMDRLWHFSGASCWELFPPSFFYTRTKEEIECIIAETDAELQELLDLISIKKQMEDFDSEKN